MNGETAPLETFDLTNTLEIGSGGTHRVYLGTDRVVKLFKHAPSAEEAAALRDVEEFSAYLAGQTQVRTTRVLDQAGDRTELVLTQPLFVEFRHIVAPITISYWELGAHGSARHPASLLD